MEGYLSFSLSSVNSSSCWAQSLINSSKASSMADRSESSAWSFFCWGAAPKFFRSDPLQKETDTQSAGARREAGCLWRGAFPLTPSMWLCPSFFSWASLSKYSFGWPQAQKATCLCLPSLGLKVQIGRHSSHQMCLHSIQNQCPSGAFPQPFLIHLKTFGFYIAYCISNVLQCWSSFS